MVLVELMCRAVPFIPPMYVLVIIDFKCTISQNLNTKLPSSATKKVWLAEYSKKGNEGRIISLKLTMETEKIKFKRRK